MDIKAVIFAAFLMAGYFKSDESLAALPVDLTLAGFAATCALFAWAVVRSRFRVPRWLPPLLTLYLLLAVPLAWTTWDAYAVEKVSRLFTLTLIASVAPLYLFRTEGDVRRLLNAITLLGAIMAIEAALTLVLQRGELLRLTAFGSSTIALGRAAGAALVWISVLAVDGALRKWAAIPAIVALGSVLIASGSRGPLLASVVALGLLLFRVYRASLKRIALPTTAFALLTLVAVLGAEHLPESSIERIGHILRGDLGSSETTRLTAYALSWAHILAWPMGTGWGGFATHVDLWVSSERQYPHNIFLETALEAGWLAASYLVGLFVVAARRAERLAVGPSTRGVFALLVFFALNAMVSGDINGNRSLFAFIGLAFALPGREAVPVRPRRLTLCQVRAAGSGAIGSPSDSGPTSRLIAPTGDRGSGND